MVPPFQWQEASAHWAIEAQAHSLGTDWCVFVTGGQRHVGALGWVGPGIDRVEELPGHREGAIVRRFLDRLALPGRTVTVVAGLHWDGLSPENIGEILTLCDTLADRVARELPR